MAVGMVTVDLVGWGVQSGSNKAERPEVIRTGAAERRTGVDWSSDLRVAAIAVPNSLTNQVCNPRGSHTQESLSALVLDSASSAQQSHLTLSRFTAGGLGGAKLPRPIPADRSTPPHTHTLLTDK